MRKQLNNFKKIIFIGMLWMLYSAIVQIQPVRANKLNFTVQAQVPANQLDKKQTYFDLAVKPNTKQDLVLNFQNDTDHLVKTQVTVNTAKTNLNGVIEYGKSKDKLDSTLRYSIAKLLLPQQKIVEIPPKSKASTSLKLNIPSQSFAGQLVGGITVKELKDTQNSKIANGLQNDYQYVIGVVLQESMAKVKPDFKLGKVRPAQVNSRNVVQAQIRNIKPQLMKNLSIVASVNDQNKKLLYQKNKKNFKMAPNSIMELPVALNGNKLKAGKYLFKAKLTDGQNEWKFQKWFTVSDKQAKKYNSQDVTIKQDNSNWYLLLIIGLLTLLVIIYLYYAGSKNRGD